MLNPGDRITANERMCILCTLRLVKKYLLDGEHKLDVAAKVDEALDLFDK